MIIKICYNYNIGFVIDKNNILFNLKFELEIVLIDVFCLDISFLVDDEIFIFVCWWGCICNGVLIGLCFIVDEVFCVLLIGG